MTPDQPVTNLLLENTKSDRHDNMIPLGSEAQTLPLS